MIATKMAVVTVSCRVGQWIFDASARTWRRNSPGLVLAMASLFHPVASSGFPPRDHRRPGRLPGRAALSFLSEEWAI